MNSIALCGFMGCGKTTVANALSAKYNLTQIDTDNYIEEKHGMTISQMFDEFGESYFRDKEHEAISALSSKADCVLSLGGGAVMFEKNVNVLKQNGCKIVFIDTDFDVIKNRLTNDSTRPLLKTNDVAELYNKRLSTYNQVCDVKISCSLESGETIADMIINSIK